MKARHVFYKAPPRRLAGLSLLELLIAILLGSMLVAGAVKIFTANTQAFRLQQVVSSAQEGGRLVMEMIKADIRRAGVGEPVDAAGNPVAAALQANNSFTPAGATGVLSPSDRLIVIYQAPVAMASCDGVNANVGDTITNTYFVANDVNPAISALFCFGAVRNQGTGLTATGTAGGTALVRGVESFQVNFGSGQIAPVAAGPGQGGFSSAIRYSRPNQLGGNRMVGAVRIGLLVRSEIGVAGLPAPINDIPILDLTVTAAAMSAVMVDGNRPVHRAFVETVALRNAVVGAL